MTKPFVAIALLVACFVAYVSAALTCCPDPANAPSLGNYQFNCAADCVWEYVGDINLDTAVNVTQNLRVVGNVYLGPAAKLAFDKVSSLNITTGCISFNSTAAVTVNINDASELLAFIRTTPQLLDFDTGCALAQVPTFQTSVALPCITLNPTCTANVGCSLTYTTSQDCAPPVVGNLIRFAVTFNISSVIDTAKIQQTIDKIKQELADFFPLLEVSDFGPATLVPLFNNATTYVATLEIPEPPALLRSFINTFGVDSTTLRDVIAGAISFVTGGTVDVSSIVAEDFNAPEALASVSLPSFITMAATLLASFVCSRLL